MSVQVLLGNEAIALGLVESGVRVATAYPGTPSSEVLAAVGRFGERMGRQIYTEWSTNERSPSRWRWPPAGRGCEPPWR
jgi:indolepyruvate ferredoxin oxidoreductase alpha subunit